MLRRLAVSLVLIFAVGCAAPEPARAPAPVVAVQAAPVSETPQNEPEIAIGRARVRAAAIVDALGLRGYGNDDATLRRAADFGLDEELARDLLATIAGPCLITSDRQSRACTGFDVLATRSDSAFEALVVLLGEIADPRGVTPTVRLLVRLRAVGSTRANDALEHLLERRMTTSYAACTPPTGTEIAKSASSIGDFAVASGKFVRAMTASERADLAYFYAAISTSGPLVGSFEEDRAATPLHDGDGALVGRRLLGQRMDAALVSGALDEHAKLGRIYLESLGFPAKVRVREESDPGSHAPGFGSVMRDLAMTLELEGESADAEALYRRANAGGGSCCGGSGSKLKGQIEGVIRTAEASRGCRAVVAERLFSVASDPRKNYGTKRLVDAGFDVARLYRGALVTLGRDDEAMLVHTLGTDPRLAPKALERLQELGTESWATRIRAIAGLAADAGKASFPDLLAIARRGRLVDRVEAIEALAEVAEDHGADPCIGRFGWGRGSSWMKREVNSLMHVCETKLTPAEADAVATELAALASASEYEIRTAVAEALGRLARPQSRPVLTTLAGDVFTTGGQTCRTDASGQHCGPDRPVRQAAEDALHALDEAEERRSEERAPASR